MACGGSHSDSCGGSHSLEAVCILIEGESINFNVQSFVYNLIYESMC